MKTFAAFAALAIAAAVAAPASAKTATSEVRVSIAGKNSVQIETEIKTAAETVCADVSKINAQDCIDNAKTSAHRQLAAIQRVRDAGKTPAAESVSVVRIALKGKSREQIHAEIRTAAATVCKAQPRFSAVSYQACVTDTVRAAKAQLQARVGAAA
jgi:UrcA family protein